MNAGAHDQPIGWIVAPAFLFCREVIAHGEQTAEALPAPRLRRADPGGLVPCSQAQAGGPPGERGLAQLVQPADLEE